MRIGVISDTHGSFHRAIPEHFAGVELILHAGDIGTRDVLTRLEAIAPLVAVTGNVDWGGSLDRRFPRTQQLTLDGCAIYMTHIGDHPATLLKYLPEPRPQVYIYGHSHVALLEHHDGVLFLNPGSAGAPRFGRPPSLALLTITDGVPDAALIWL